MKSASNRQKTLLRKLGRKKYRQKEQLYLLEGHRAVLQVLDNPGQRVEALFFDESKAVWDHPSWQKYNHQEKSFMVPSAVFREVTDTDHPQGVLALCRMSPEATLEEMVSRRNIIIALDALQDPGNLGTIIRTAVWFGAGGLLSGKGTVDMFHPKVVRSTAGATGQLPFINGDLDELLPSFEQAGWPVFILDAAPGAITLSEVEAESQAILVVGNEGHGVSPELINERRHRIKIASPRSTPEVESLNAAVAASVALYAFAPR